MSRVCGREARTGVQLLDPGRRKEGTTVTAAQRDTPDTAAPHTGPHRITCGCFGGSQEFKYILK